MSLSLFRPRSAPLDPVIVTSTSPAAIEPTGAEFQQLKTQLHRELIEALDLSRIAAWDEARLRQHLREMAATLLAEKPELAARVQVAPLIEELMAESFGLGPLEPYLHDDQVSDILVNGPHEVYVERAGRLHPTSTVFADDAHLMQIIQRVVARVGRRIDELSPMVDARLPDGSRVNAIIPPLALNGPVLSIRRFGRVPLEVNELEAQGSIAPAMTAFLKAAVEGRINLLISGGAGAGKTTLLAALARFIPEGQRLVTIEDSAELQLRRRHVVRLETRPATAEGTGEVTQREMVRNSLRMRPDRILLGEVRGAEALDMLQAMNTGHEGSMTTIHANDAVDALARLEVMVSMAGFELPLAVVQRYIASAITLVVHLARLPGGARRVMRVVEIDRLAGGEFQLRELFGFRPTGVDADGRARGAFYATGETPRLLARLDEQGVAYDRQWFTAGQIATGN